jgi:hypothetical protein
LWWLPPLRAAVWPKVAFAPGNLTVVARDAAGAGSFLRALVFDHCRARAAWQCNGYTLL